MSLIPLRSEGDSFPNPHNTPRRAAIIATATISVRSLNRGGRMARFRAG